MPVWCFVRLLLLSTVLAAPVFAEIRTGVYPVRDSLKPGHEPDAAARACLDGFLWSPQEFRAEVRPPRRAGCDALVRFPSPVSTGDPLNDLVAMEWYAPKDAAANTKEAPAVVVVHESGARMPAGRMFARGMQAAGFHAFLIHLPHYGERRAADRDPDIAQLPALVQQAVADVRRARDVVAVLPSVQDDRIALQGTSLGGFVTALAGSLDRVYRPVLITLAGGNVYEMLLQGEKDSAQMREGMAQAGLTGDRLRTALWPIEPTRLAHRLDASHTWLFSADQDRVVPLENALALARSIGLAPQHHVRVQANHYTAIVYFPLILQQMADAIRQTDP